LYTAYQSGIYHVDLATGYTKKVASFDHLPDGQGMNAFLYDPGQHIIYATSATSAYYLNPDRRNWNPLPNDGPLWLAPFEGWQINPATWALAAGVSYAGNGVYSDGIDTNDQYSAHADVAAYDPTSGFIYEFFTPVDWSPNNGPDISGTGHLSRIDPATGKRQEIISWGSPFAPPFTPAAQPIFQVAIDPLDGTLWSFGFGFDQGQPFVNDVSQAWDKDTGTVIRWIVTPIPDGIAGFGPAAFYPGTHTLYRYGYDGQGNAWLYHIDLTTGQAVRVSAAFWAPATAMFFVPRQLVP
jgi:hypothetical protein